MIAFIDDQRVVYGVGSICRVLPIAPSTYYHRLACRAEACKASARHQRDTKLRPAIKRVWDENYQVYGVRKAWHQLKREGFTLARCTVERLMKQIGIRGAVRGKVIKTTIPDTSAPCPRDKVNRVFRAPAPNLLRVSDFTYVSTWQGFVYVAFVIDTFADRIVGWRVSRSAKTDFEKRAKVGDALKGGISWRCSRAVDSLPRKGYATCQRRSSPSCLIHPDFLRTH